MKKVKITRVDGNEAGAHFEDEVAMQFWIDDNIANNSWGKPDLWASEHDLTDKQIERAVSSRQIEIDGAFHVEYHIPAEYSIEITDITEQEDAKKAAHQLKKDRIKFLKNKENLSKEEIEEAVKLLLKDYYLGVDA